MGDLETDSFMDRFKCFLDFLIKGLPWNVGAYCNVGMAYPGIEGALIEVACHLKTFMASIVVLQSIEVLSSVGCRGQEDDSVIPAITESHPAPSLFVHNGLELLLRDISSRVCSSSIAKHNSW